jgi:hypothetical protein
VKIQSRSTSGHRRGIHVTISVETPDPLESGADGLQVKSESNALPTPVQSFPTVVSAVVGLTSTNSRSFGGEVVSTLLAGAVSQMSIELNQCKEELARLRNKYELAMHELSDEKTKKSILIERINSFRSIRNLINIGISIGALLIGIGIPLILDEKYSYGFPLTIAGSLLMVFSWFSVPKRGEE